MKKIAFTLLAVLYTVTVLGAQPRILAHRGGRAEQEENTLEAFKATYEAGCHGFETDIHMTADGELVIMHDFYLSRMTVGEGIIESLPASYIRGLKTKQGHRVPFLDDLLGFFSSCEGLYVEFELKTNTEHYPDEVLEPFCDKVWDAVMKDKPQDALYVLSSFDERPLQLIKSKHPEAQVMLITGSPCCKETVERCVSLGIGRMAATLNGTSRLAVSEAHGKGLLINLWPGNTVADTELAALLGADYLCTDIPAEVMKDISEKHLDIISR